jgi:hypothetical protein
MWKKQEDNIKERSNRKRLRGQDMDRYGSELCPIVGLDVSSVQTPGLVLTVCQSASYSFDKSVSQLLKNMKNSI